MAMNRIKFLFILSILLINVFCSSNKMQGVLQPDLEEFGAYYTRINSGEEFEKYARVGDYADIIVDLGKENGKFVFWRGASYLPYWQTANGKWFVDEIVPRKGDGGGKMPDKVNTYSHAKIIESNQEKVVVHWRYLPEFSGKNPHKGVSAVKFVDEYFTITPTGEVTRIVRKGTKKIDDWRDPLNRTTQKFLLTPNGIKEVEFIKPCHSKKVVSVERAPVKTEVVANPVAWWKFDEAHGDFTLESVSKIKSSIEGHKSLWRKGVSGTALQFDGYTSVINFPGEKAPKVSSAITLEGWVALGAYPWSWAPIIQQCDDVPEEIERIEEKGENQKEANFKIVLKKENDTGYFLGIDGHGYPCFKLKVGDRWEELTSNVHLERRQWYHLAGTFDKDTGKMIIYVNGQPAGEKKVAHENIVMALKDIKIGQGKPRRPVDPVRMNTFVDTFSIDGLIDEIRIYDKALTANQIKQSFENFKPSLTDLKNPQMDKRVLPQGESRGKFGAYYTQLKFYDVWDNLWRVSEHPDVVVEFDELPTKFIFWRGTGYIPMIVNEKGQWYSNEFNETWNKSGGKGCQEPMSDKEGYTNHARIIENTNARVVIHWRYPLVDVFHVFANYNEDTGWGDWADWYFYIYPDGWAVKKMHLWTNGERNHEWQESMAIFGPDQHPEQIIEKKNTLMMINLNGEAVKYDWVQGPPPNVDKPKDKCIQYINYTGEYDPVTIGKFIGSNVYGGELTSYAVFPTWNHWPVAQMPSDGRYASFPDRAAHSSLTHLFLPTYAEDFGDRPFQEKILMEGMSNADKDELVMLARSWLNAPEVKSSGGCSGCRYDPAQRAYVMEATAIKIKFTLNGSKLRPIFNPCFVIKHWNSKDKASLKIDNIGQASGMEFRQGIIRDIDGTYTLIVWVKKRTTRPIQVEIFR